MENRNEYKKGTPKVSQWRMCPECKKPTLEWINLGEACVWSCSSCGYEEADKEAWTIPIPKGLKFIKID